MRYAAIDFETASGSPASAVSVGIVRMDEEGCEAGRFYSLIRPKQPAFDPACSAVHHLDPLDILRAPSIADIWPEISAFIGDLPLVAHNAPFDMKVLSASLASWGLEPGHNEYYCTLSLARRLWKGRRSYSLSSIASNLGWEHEAHNALSDSIACGRLFSRLCGAALYDDEVSLRFFRRVYRDGSYPKHL